MGAQDSLAFAQDFVASTGTSSFPMIWDENFTTWNYYQIGSQPNAILVDKDGSPITGWRGRFPPDAVLEQVAALS